MDGELKVLFTAVVYRNSAERVFRWHLGSENAEDTGLLYGAPDRRTLAERTETKKAFEMIFQYSSIFANLTGASPSVSLMEKATLSKLDLHS